jgi:hypothetical protein
MANLIQPSKVDWDVVDEELDKVPEEFKDPRFDSLRHVLDILSAVDADAALEEVRNTDFHLSTADWCRQQKSLNTCHLMW